MGLEADFQRDLMHWLKRQNIEHWRMPIGPVMQRGGKNWSPNPLKGFPDIMGICTKVQRGRMWAVELKSPVGKISKEQAKWMARLKMAGAEVAVLRNMAEAILFFRTIGEYE